MPTSFPPMEADVLIDELVEEALRRRATDVHLTPRGRAVGVDFRVDGVVHPSSIGLDGREHELVVGRLKVLSNLNIAQRRQPQAGAFTRPAVDGNLPLELRVSFLPTIDGESAALRILHGAAGALLLTQLGIDESTLARLRVLVARPSGLVVSVGPTGSGKTTTLYALASELAGAVRRVIAVEDPVERRIDGATQVAVSRDEGLDFAAALRGILRHDPDVILVGEIRDRETASIALAAGLSGHLVLASLHAEGPLSALERLVHLEADRSQLVAVLSGVLTQRLVRLRCGSCAGAQCPRCGGTGYRGRTGIFALFEPDPALRRRLLSRDPELTAAGEDLTGLAAQGLSRVRAGETTARELERVLPGAGLAAREVTGVVRRLDEVKECMV